MSSAPTAPASPADSGPAPGLHETARSGVAFLAIGGGAAALFIVLSTWILGLDTGIPRWLASTGCYALLVLPAYLLHHRFTFRSSVSHAVALPKYMVTQAMAVMVSAAMAIPVYHLFHLSPLPGSVLVTGLTSVGSYVVLRVWTFR